MTTSTIRRAFVGTQRSDSKGMDNGTRAKVQLFVSTSPFTLARNLVTRMFGAEVAAYRQVRGLDALNAKTRADIGLR